MITLKIKPNEHLEIESAGATVKSVSVLETEGGQIVVRFRVSMPRDSLYPQTATWVAVWNGKKSESFDARVTSIDFDAKTLEVLIEMSLDKLMFLVPTIWRDFVRDSIVKFREAAFDPSLRG